MWAVYYALLGDKEKALSLPRNGHVYALLEMKDEAIDQIQREIEKFDWMHTYLSLKKLNFYDNLRGDPRFQALIDQQKSKYEEYLIKYRLD